MSRFPSSDHLGSCCSLPFTITLELSPKGPVSPGEMFDVIWTDPGVETVGNRKARKEQEQEQGFRDSEDARLSKRGSTSTRRSSSSADKSAMAKYAGDKASGIFRSFGLKKHRLSSKSKISHASDLRIPIPEANTVTPSLPTASTFRSEFSSTDFLGERSLYSQSQFDPKESLDQLEPWWEQSQESQISLTRGMSYSLSQFLPISYMT